MEKEPDKAYENTANEVGPGASVPPELFPQIIRNVAKKDLLACSRVCRAWLGFSQPFIFRTLSLWLVSQCVRWNMKFDAYPRLLSMVEEVRLYGGKDYISMDPEASNGSDSEVYVIFLMKEPQVVRLLSRLAHLRLLSLHNIQLEPNQLLAFQNMTLVEVLDLSRVRFPSHRDACRFLEKMPNISALSFDFGVKWVGAMASDDPRNAISSSGPILLKALTLCNVDVEVALLSWLLGSFFDLSGLHTLKIMWKMNWGDNDPPKPGTYALYEELILTCSHVKYLTLAVSHFVTPDNPDFCLDHLVETKVFASFRSIETITFFCDLAVEDCIELRDINAVVRVLEAMDAPRLHRIQLCIRISSEVEEDELGDQDVPWSFFDSILTSESFPALRRVVFFTQVDVKSARDQVARMITNQLPKLVSRDCLRFDRAKTRK
ncbi:hypothetical protein ARMGADRAFT_1157278 [Armillaria gallica]|uniref:F-box domain-containing protein n=1 Tax=Armillaria gallica TaxID=47427 RepID=A0A2H3EIA7_ARMGA|nr:hypothetical protein ARMGADRAFT_1157278 [Armillaria gallica]